MPARPIALLGGEPSCLGDDCLSEAGFTFDGRLGVWRDVDGLAAIHSRASQTTHTTRTREGTDQTESATLSSRITKTREGIDQVESGR